MKKKCLNIYIFTFPLNVDKYFIISKFYFSIVFRELLFHIIKFFRVEALLSSHSF